jgi:hypothetical protein
MGTIAVSAATPEWSYDATFGIIFQVVADGKGGCAVMGVQTNSSYHVAWLDKKGNVIYDKTLVPGGVVLNIYGASKKGLMFGIQTMAGPELITVDKDGVESGQAYPVNSLYFQVGVPPYGASITQDKKGFFFQLRDPLTGIYTLERYSFK